MAVVKLEHLPERLRSHELVGMMLASANSKAVRVAPCLKDSTDEGTLAEAALALVGAITRWADSGSGGVTQQTAGVFSQTIDTSQKVRGYLLWPSEIAALQALCAESGSGGGSSRAAYSFAPAGVASSAHLPWCSSMFGALYCSCGLDLTNGERPIYEGGLP